MTTAISATPRCSVRLYKTISRQTVDGVSGVSARYAGKDPYIDLTPYLNDRSSVRTQKSVREPAGAFTITFADRPNESFGGGGYALESVYGLVEPMDMVEIRMWGGTGFRPAGDLPIVMRGFVSEVQRGVSMGENGQPQRQVVVSGQDYGKIWQMFQVIYLRAYFERQSLLTNFSLWTLYGVQVTENSQPAGEFVRVMVDKVINKHLREFIPEDSVMPREILTGESISVKHGRVNNSYQSMEGSIYDIMRFHGDVGVWNELYTEDTEEGVQCVYRATPALHLTAPSGGSRKIMEDAPDPIYVDVRDQDILALSVSRSDANVANFYWVNNERFDLIDDMQRKLASLKEDEASVSLKEYPNTAVRYYGTRTMQASTQQAGDDVKNTTSGIDKDQVEQRSKKQEEWITKRRRQMVEMNRDNVVFERGVMRVKGGLERRDGNGLLRAGDYARVLMGELESEAYVVQIEHEFMPFNSYTSTLVFERGTGFAERVRGDRGRTSPWLLEQTKRVGRLL